MAKSCKEIAEALVDCLKTSKCVRDGGGLRKCLGGPEGAGEGAGAGAGLAECQELRAAYFTCKRSGLDMRTRIKGQKVY